MTAGLRAVHSVLLRGLHPLTHGRGADFGGQADDAPADRLVLPAPADAGDESPVDLEDVDGVAAQVGQRALAGAEVVDGDLDPQRRGDDAVVELPREHVQSKTHRQEQVGGLAPAL